MSSNENGNRYQFVMLIDDNELDNFLNEKILKLGGFAEKIHVNSSGISALEYLKGLTSKEAAIYPDLIFVDVNMPIMDGFQFIEHLRAIDGNKFNKTKLVILTSSLRAEDRERTEALGNVTFLTKPLTVEMLAAL